MVSTDNWGQLPAGAYDLPGPAILTNPWVLEAREPRPRRLGFTRITRPHQWTRPRTAPRLIADYRRCDDLSVIHADHPTDVNADALRDLTPGCRTPGGVRWTMGSMFRGSTADTFHRQVHQRGQLLLLTGDLNAYWDATNTGTTATFNQLFPDGTWAAWVPLLTHLYPDGVGTRPR